MHRLPSVVLLLLACCTTRGQDPPKRAPEGGVELRAVLGREVYEVGQPVLLLVGLVNTGDARRLPPPDVEYLRVEILRPEAKEWERFDLGERRVRPELLARGGIDVAVFDLHLRRDRWWLREPGVYRVRLAYTDAPHAEEVRWLARAEVGFELRAPEGSRAAELMTDPAVARFLAQPTASTFGAAQAQLEAAFAVAQCAPYLHTAVGAYLARERYDPKTDTFRADHAAARAHFERALGAADADALTKAAAAAGLLASLRASAPTETAETTRKRLLSQWDAHPQREVIVRWITGADPAEGK